MKVYQVVVTNKDTGSSFVAKPNRRVRYYHKLGNAMNKAKCYKNSYWTKDHTVSIVEFELVQSKIIEI